MSRPRRISDEQILEAMRLAVFTHGPSVSLDEVARQLSVTAPALLKRFGSRQALLVAALVPPEPAAWLTRLGEGPTANAFGPQLEALLGSLSAVFEEVLPRLMALRESGLPPSCIFSRETPAPVVRVVEGVARWLARAQALGLAQVPFPQATATALVGSMSTRAFMAHLSNAPWTPQEQATYLHQVASVFLSALALPQGRARRPASRKRPTRTTTRKERSS